jgi:hypothetical protein
VHPVRHVLAAGALLALVLYPIVWLLLLPGKPGTEVPGRGRTAISPF